jgi:hypothetical protein
MWRNGSITGRFPASFGRSWGPKVFSARGCRRSMADWFVDTEDVAVAADALEPGKFKWQRCPDQIDMHTVRTCLLTQAQGNGSYITGSLEAGWMLTENGVAFSKKHEEKFPDPGRLLCRLSQEEMRFRPWHKKRMQAQAAYKKVVAGLSEKVTAEEAERFFLIDHDAKAETREERVNFFMRSFGYDRFMGPVVRVIAEKAI